MSKAAALRMKIIEKVNAQSTETLLDLVRMIKDKISDENEIIMQYVLNALMDRMSEKDFCELCAELD